MQSCSSSKMKPFTIYCGVISCVLPFNHCMLHYIINCICTDHNGPTFPTSPPQRISIERMDPVMLPASFSRPASLDYYPWMGMIEVPLVSSPEVNRPNCQASHMRLHCYCYCCCVDVLPVCVHHTFSA